MTRGYHVRQGSMFLALFLGGACWACDVSPLTLYDGGVPAEASKSQPPVQPVPLVDPPDAGETTTPSPPDASAAPTPTPTPPPPTDAGLGGTIPVDSAGSAGQPFPYSPSNFAPEAVPLTEVDLHLGCGVTTFDATSLSFGNLCPGSPAPRAMVVAMKGGGEAALIAVRSLTIDPSARLDLTGARPVIIAVLGNVTIAGEVRAAAARVTGGAGARSALACGTSAGAVGQGNGGGSGGGFGDSGGAGGGRVLNRVSGGRGIDVSTLVPLLGGCPGGDGGPQGSGGGTGGAGGGALQISSAGVLDVTGMISATGGGGGGSRAVGAGGGGGGSGGAVLLEAAVVHLEASMAISTRGGDGGEGDDAMAVDGADGIAPDANQLQNQSSAPGGGGATGASGRSQNGGDAGDGAGGGGGGSVGFVRVNAAQDCRLDRGTNRNVVGRYSLSGC